jgi:hypothetical protein
MFLEVNLNLIGIGCSSHIAHNAAQDAVEKMTFEKFTIEDIALKVSTHFSHSAQRWEFLGLSAEELDVWILKIRGSLFVWLQIYEVPKIPTHGATRWLTLDQLIGWVLRMWPVLELYFRDEGTAFLKGIFCQQQQSLKFKAAFAFGSFVLTHFNKFNCVTQVEFIKNV